MSALEAPGTPSEVIRRLIAAVAGQRWEEVADLYDPRAVVEHPFAIPEPSRLEGLEQLRAHFAAGSQIPVRFEARNLVVHLTENPEVVVAEFDYVGEVTTSGQPFSVKNVFITTVHEGRIVASRDYGNHFRLAAALGRLDDVVAALGAGERR